MPRRARRICLGLAILALQCGGADPALDRTQSDELQKVRLYNECGIADKNPMEVYHLLAIDYVEGVSCDFMELVPQGAEHDIILECFKEPCTGGGGYMGWSNIPSVPCATENLLFLLALHELMHALGFPHDDDPSSVMYHTITGDQRLTVDHINGLVDRYCHSRRLQSA